MNDNIQGFPETIEGDYCEALQVWHNYYAKLAKNIEENMFCLECKNETVACVCMDEENG
jgi:hypothetical protein